tara:strand:- start:371 stop:1708 length:1338 start_codon:yes stop_codon:yes gene_type:complete
MFGLKLMIQSAFAILSCSSGGNGDIMPPMVGGQRDSNNCLIGAGFTWCEATQECIRRWETPCQDNFSDCNDCLTRQRNGENIACPVQCDNIKPVLNGIFDDPICEPCPPPIPCPSPGPECEYSPPITDECGCNIGCGQINCIAIDPLPILEPPMPEPPHLVCSEVMCMMYCENGWQIDDNGCNICACNEIPSDINNEEICPIMNSDCPGEYVCPKITEITQCGSGGISGYTTYQLSLLIQNPTIMNIYALFGNSNVNGERGQLIIPGAYQVKNNFGTNIGGISDHIYQFSKNSVYDSWITIGITNGDPENKLGTIGIDFESWNLNTPLVVDNGAVFLLDPNEPSPNLNEIIIGQLTLPNDESATMIVNVQGKLFGIEETWKQYQIIFNISPPAQINNQGTIPNNCRAWFDGCNTCQVINGVIAGCTKLMCFTEDIPYCMNFYDGH